jgi:20S proteasome alpha/beta subunit
MTYILGAKCSDGVVLVADRKIIDGDDTVGYGDKLFMHDFPIVQGGAGSLDLFDKFRYESYLEAMKYKDNINWLSYIDDVEDITRKLNKRYGDERFEVIIAGPIRHPEDVVPRLYYIPPSGLSKQIHRYKVIGSGEPYGSIFLGTFWRKKSPQSMQDVAELGYFIIRNIEENKLDAEVGLDKNQHPQIYRISNDGEVTQDNEEQLGTIRKKVDVWLSTYNSEIENLFSGPYS